jgi:hypothetical protein
MLSTAEERRIPGGAIISSDPRLRRPPISWRVDKYRRVVVSENIVGKGRL